MSMTGDANGAPGALDIAVVGMACRVPGARTPAEFWRLVRDGVESVRTFTDEELAKAGVPAAVRSRPNYVKAGLVLEDMEMFDAAFFGFSPKDAAIMDPQHRHFLECAWEALEDAGHTAEGFKGSIGVFGGSGMTAYMMWHVAANAELMASTGLFLLRHTNFNFQYCSSEMPCAFKASKFSSSSAM